MHTRLLRASPFSSLPALFATFPTLLSPSLLNAQALEDNQVQVQGMMANRYMATFKDEILSWNKQLMNVADVNQILSEIQRTWAYLESLFIHSEEVKKELPEATVRFASIDKEVKEVSCSPLVGYRHLVMSQTWCLFGGSARCKDPTRVGQETGWARSEG